MPSERGVSALLPTRKVAEKFNRSQRTVERWTDAGILPQPKKINGRKYWDADVEPKFDDPPEAT